MCELIISVIDKGDQLHWVKRGSVIEVLEDGHDYGLDELNHPMFRIIKLPGVPLAFGRSFMGAEVGDPRYRHQLLGRQFTLDLDHPSIPADLQAHIADHNRMQSSYTVDLQQWNIDDINKIKTKRVRTDQTVIGDPSNVIG